MKALPLLSSYGVKRWRLKRLPPDARDAAWDSHHLWAAERGRRLVADLAGFYTKVGQITGSLNQMMPPAWCDALAETMDAAPPRSFRHIKRTVERDLGRPIADVFETFDETPVATASIAQVHRARFNGTEVAVKVNLGHKRLLLADVDAMYRQAVLLKKLRLDAGLDLPSVVRAYRDICADEFDFRIELEKLERFAKLFRDDARLRGTMATAAPLPNLCGERVLVCEWLDGAKLLDVFRDSPPPPAPAILPDAQRRLFGSWTGLRRRRADLRRRVAADARGCDVDKSAEKRRGDVAAAATGKFRRDRASGTRRSTAPGLRNCSATASSTRIRIRATSCCSRTGASGSV